MNDTEYLEHIKAYSLGQLNDALGHINSDKHPQRVAMLVEQKAERRKAGEIVESMERSARDPLWRRSISWETALAVWWAFAWRSILVCIPLNFLVLIALALLHGIAGTPPLFAAIAFQAAAILLAAVVGVSVMKAVLSKKYKNIVIFAIGEKDPKMSQGTGDSTGPSE